MKLIFVAALAFLAAVGWSHDLGLTRIELRGGLVTVTAPISKLARLSHLGPQPGPAQFDAAIRSRLKLNSTEGNISLGPADLTLDSNNDMFRWRATTTSQVESVSVADRFFPEDPTSRTIVSTNGQDSVVGSLVPRESFIVLGFQHILGGADHILFVLGLVLVGGSLKQLLKVVTAFTVAHSVTLALTVTKYAQPNPRIVEPLIALSIVAVSLEGLRKKSVRDFRVYIAFGFGLIHGFGFADALAKLDLTGLNLASSLATCNLGVEFGQATILIPAALAIRALCNYQAQLANKVVIAGSTVIGMTGAYWFVNRILS